MAREVTAEQKDKMREGKDAETQRRRDCHANRFVCAGWAIWDGDGLNFFLQPEAHEPDNSSQRSFFKTFPDAIEHGLLPKLGRDGDKRSAEVILKECREVKASVMDAIQSHAAKYEVVLPRNGQ